jgi:cobaltochelatase CobS
MAYILPVMTNEARSDVRSFLRQQNGFEAFRAAHGSFASRDFSAGLMQACIEALAVEAEVTAILDRHASRATVGAAVQAAIDVDNVRHGEAVPMVETEAEGVTLDERGLLSDSVLDQLRPFVSDKMLRSVEAALSPIVDKALKPAVVVERERVVERVVDANGVAMPAAAAPASVTATSTFGRVFNVRHAMSGLPVKLWNASDAPRVDPMYVVNAGDMALMTASCERGENVWLGGPAGTGKSTMPEQYAARTGRPLTAISFSRAIDQVEIIGQAWLTGAGRMEWRDGVLTAALRKPGTVIVLDEIMAAPPGMLFVIQTLLSYRYMLIHSTGERVECATGVTFVCADNTMGYGDETGMYAGTMIGNAALVDRMAAMVRVDYLPADIEAQALANHTGAPRAACDRVVAFVNGARKLPGFESRPLSLRRMVAFVNKVADGF